MKKISFISIFSVLIFAGLVSASNTGTVIIPLSNQSGIGVEVDPIFTAWNQTNSGGNLSFNQTLTNSLYLFQDGSKPLTGNWNVGNYIMTTIGNIVHNPINTANSSTTNYASSDLRLVSSLWTLAGWSAPQSSYFSLYNNRQKITIDSSKMFGNLTNYTIKVTVANNVTNSIFTQSLASGFDIGFSDSSGNNVQSRRMYYNSTNSTMIYQVKLPSVSNTTNLTFYTFYNNPAAADQSNNSNALLNGNESVGLFAMYSFDGNLNDTSGNNRQLTSGNTSCLFADGNRTYNYRLKWDGSPCDKDGINYQPTAAEQNQFNATGGATLSIWDNLNRSANNGAAEYMYYMTFNVNGGYIRGWLHQSVTNWYTTCYNGSVASDNSGTALGADYGGNTWRNYVVTFAWNTSYGMNVTWYRDGVNKNTFNCNNMLFYKFDPAKFEVGAANGGATLNASVDDIMIWNRTLTSSEILNNFNLRKLQDNNVVFGAQETIASASPVNYSFQIRNNGNGNQLIPTYNFLISDNSNALLFNLSNKGTVTTTNGLACSYFNPGDSALSTCSSEAIKTNIVNINKTSALDRITNLNPKQYDYADNEKNVTFLLNGNRITFIDKKREQPVYGLLAENVYDTYKTDPMFKGDNQTVDWNYINMQQLSTIIELTNKVKSLEENITLLESRITKLENPKV